MIHWNVFFENTSSREELFDFANGGGFDKFAKFIRGYSNPEMNKEIKIIQNMDKPKVRLLAKRSLRKEGYR